MQKWEYKIVRDPRADELNKMGTEGWELVSVVADVSGHADPTDSTIYAYLKRPKQK